MFIVVVGVLSIVLTLNGPPFRFVTDTRLVLVCLALAVALPPLVALIFARRAVQLFDRRPDQPSRGQGALHTGMMLAQWLLGAVHAGLLLATDWRKLVASTPVVGHWIVIPDLIAIAPFIFTVFLMWIACYPADRAVRQIALELHLLQGRPVRPVWSLGQFLSYSFRHQVAFILIPMIVMLAVSDLALRYEDRLGALIRLPHAADLLIGVAAILVAVVAPELLRHVWATERLPDGPLRDRLLAMARTLGVRCREILVWRSGGMIVNAAVMGVVPPLRYVLITDAMLEQLDDTKIEAVFGHEVGHVRHHHIPFYLLFALISGCLLTVFAVRTHGLSRTDPILYQALLAAAGTLLLVKWGVLFGWVSRRFERQADTFGVRALALAGLPCAQPCELHSGGENGGGARLRDPLCRTGAAIFGDALHEVAVLNGIQADARSWRHSSISSRARFVQRLAASPKLYRTFQSRVTLIQGVITLLAAVCALWAAWEMRLVHTVLSWIGWTV
jgi:STE24 endopeptidase